MKFLTVGETAKRLAVSVDSVRRFERTGALSAVKVGKGIRLFELRDVERFREQRERRSGQATA